MKRVLVVGTGSIGMQHAESLRARGHDVLLFPSREGRAVQLQQSGWHCVTTWQQAYDEGYTHSIIATRTKCHTRDIVAALRGAPLKILVEKPLAHYLDDAAPLRQLDAGSQSKIICGFDLRYQKSLRFFRSMLSELGSIHSAFVECRSWLPDWRPRSDYHQSYSASIEDGGVLRDLSHEVDYAGWLFGWPESVSAILRTSPHLGIAADDQAFMQYQAPIGAVVQLALDYLGKPPRRRATAFGLLGTLSWDALRQEVVWESAGGQAERWVFAQTRQEVIAEQHQDFLSCGCRWAVNLPDALRSLAVLEAARNSADTGQWCAVAA